MFSARHHKNLWRQWKILDADRRIILCSSSKWVWSLCNGDASEEEKASYSAPLRSKANITIQNDRALFTEHVLEAKCFHCWFSAGHASITWLCNVYGVCRQQVLSPSVGVIDGSAQKNREYILPMRDYRLDMAVRCLRSVYQTSKRHSYWSSAAASSEFYSSFRSGIRAPTFLFASSSRNTHNDHYQVFPVALFDMACDYCNANTRWRWEVWPNLILLQWSTSSCRQYGRFQV